MRTFKISTFTHSDLVNNDAALDRYDFDNEIFDFYFTIDNYDGQEEIELVMTVDSEGFEVNLKMDNRDELDIYDMGWEEAEEADLPTKLTSLEEAIEFEEMFKARVRKDSQIERMEQVPMPTQWDEMAFLYETTFEKTQVAA